MNIFRPGQSEIATGSTDNDKLTTQGYVDEHETTTPKVEMSLLGTPTYTDVQDFINLSQGGSIWEGMAITDGGSGTVNIGVGTGLIKTTNSAVGENVSFDFAGTTGLVLTDVSTNYIYIDYNSGSPIGAANISLSALNLRTQLIIGRVYRSGTSANILQVGQYFAEYQTKSCQKDFEVDGFQRASGEIIGETGTRNITVTAGVDYCAHNRITTPAIDTSAADTYDVWNSSASTSADTTGVAQVDNANYWNGAAVVALTPNRYATRFFYRAHDGFIHMQYGTSNAVSQATAKAETVPTPPAYLRDFSLYIGRIVIEQGAAVFATITNPFTTVEEGTEVTDHGDLAGLTDDDHSQYAFLSGRSGGQIWIGGTGSGEDAVIESTSDATKGLVKLQPNGGNVTIGSAIGLTGNILDIEQSLAGSSVVQVKNTSSSGSMQYEANNDLGYNIAIGVLGSTASVGVFVANSGAILASGYAALNIVNDGNNPIDFATDVTDSHALAATVKLRIQANGLLASLVTNYETLVVADNDIPNRKFVTDLISGGGDGGFRDKNGANLPSKFFGLERQGSSNYIVSTAGTEFQNSTTTFVSIVSLRNGNTMFCYRDVNDSSRGKFKIYDPFGGIVKAATIFEQGAAAYISAAVLTSGNVVIAFQDSDDSNIGKAVVYTQEGVLAQSTMEFESGTTQNIKVTALTNGNYLVAYTDVSASSHGKFVIIQEDKTIVEGPTTFNSISTVNIATLTMTNSNIMIAFPDALDSQNGAFIILDEDGVVVLAKTSFEGSDTDFISISSFTNGHMIIAYQDDGDGDVGKFVIYTNEGILVKAAVEFESNLVEQVSTATLSTGNILICWKEAADKGYFVIYDVRGEVVQEKTLFETDKVNYVSATALTTGDFAIAYQNDDASDRGHFTIFKPGITPLPLTVARVTTAKTDVTGDGAGVYVTLYDTEDIDSGNLFNPATGLFTADADMIVEISTVFYLTGIDATHTILRQEVDLDNPAGIWIVNWLPIDYSKTGEVMAVNGSITLKMVASQQAKVELQVVGTNKTVDFDVGSQISFKVLRYV